VAAARERRSRVTDAASFVSAILFPGRRRVRCASDLELGTAAAPKVVGGRAVVMDDALQQHHLRSRAFLAERQIGARHKFRINVSAASSNYKSETFDKLHGKLAAPTELGIVAHIP